MFIVFLWFSVRQSASDGCKRTVTPTRASPGGVIDSCEVVAAVNFKHYFSRLIFSLSLSFCELKRNRSGRGVLILTVGRSATIKLRAPLRSPERTYLNWKGTRKKGRDLGKCEILTVPSLRSIVSCKQHRAARHCWGVALVVPVARIISPCPSKLSHLFIVPPKTCVFPSFSLPSPKKRKKEKGPHKKARTVLALQPRSNGTT